MFSDLKQGDVVTRMLGGVLPMTLKVAKIEDGVITVHGGWQFDVATGAEIDTDLNWGPPSLMTGSYLVKQ